MTLDDLKTLDNLRAELTKVRNMIDEIEGDNIKLYKSGLTYINEPALQAKVRDFVRTHYEDQFDIIADKMRSLGVVIREEDGLYYTPPPRLEIVDADGMVAISIEIPPTANIEDDIPF